MLFSRAHASRVVNRVFAIEQKLRYGHDSLAVGNECLDDTGQSLRRVQSGVVEEHD